MFDSLRDRECRDIICRSFLLLRKKPFLLNIDLKRRLQAGHFLFMGVNREAVKTCLQNTGEHSDNMLRST